MPKEASEPSSPQSAIPDGLQFTLDPRDAAYRYISERLRDLILSRKIIAGTKLPPIQQLAKMWKTNYFTVQTALTPLVNEGLLVRRQKSGTYVSENVSQVKNIAFYVPAYFWHQKHAGFFSQVLYVALSDHFEKLGVGHHLFVDSRPTLERTTPWKPLMKAMESREINAIVAIMPTKGSLDWLDHLTIPTTVFSGNHPRSVQLDHEDMIMTGLLRLKERGCHKVGFVQTEAWLANIFLRLTKELGLLSSPAWISTKKASVAEYEEFGFHEFKEIWSHQERPDGLLVYPDAVARGLVMAILEKGVQVPENLKLVLHYNDEASYFCPLPVDWLVVRISTVVETCWEHLMNQARGHAPVEWKFKAVILPETL